MFLFQDSTPRIVKFGDYPGGPCGGTHVADISIINNIKVMLIDGVYFGAIFHWLDFLRVLQNS
jgi:alanyl-tRNA synthetase